MDNLPKKSQYQKLYQTTSKRIGTIKMELSYCEQLMETCPLWWCPLCFQWTLLLLMSRKLHGKCQVNFFVLHPTQQRLTLGISYSFNWHIEHKTKSLIDKWIRLKWKILICYLTVIPRRYGINQLFPLSICFYVHGITDI